jgi:membrane protein implicated in regulation of membrane protease activity
VKRLRWDAPDRHARFPKNPYRDSALVYGALAVLVVLIALATGGGLARALITASIVFVVATLWSWRTWRNRVRDRGHEEGRAP